MSQIATLSDMTPVSERRVSYESAELETESLPVRMSFEPQGAAEVDAETLSPLSPNTFSTLYLLP